MSQKLKKGKYYIKTEEQVVKLILKLVENPRPELGFTHIELWHWSSDGDWGVVSCAEELQAAEYNTAVWKPINEIKARVLIYTWFDMEEIASIDNYIGNFHD